MKFGDEHEGSLKNGYLYNDKELWEDADLDWYDYGFRNYDPQIARFTQLDPLTWDYPYYTPYQYAGNEPIANVDLDGLEPIGSTVAGGIVSAGSFMPEIILKAGTKVASSGSSLLGKALITGLKAAGAGISTFAKGLWNEGVMPTIDFVNHTVNLPYAIFNGINSQFTHQDFLRGTPMTRMDGFTELGTAVFPAGRFGKIGKSLFKFGRPATKGGVNAVEQVAVHGNSLKSLKPTWGYKLFSQDGTFLKNGITNKLIPETRYTKAFMSDKYMEAIPFPNRLGAYQWEFGQNQILRGPLNFNMH